MEALERRRKAMAIIALLVFIFSSLCHRVEGQRNNTKMSYVCPPNFIRLGHSCYFFSENEATWKDALFACKDRDSTLSVPARWEDRNLRNYLNKEKIEKASRWIGGTYDYAEKAWRWGGELRKMHYQSFSKMKKMTPEELNWHCIAMLPELLYRWAPRSCLDKQHYICQTKLRKVPKSKLSSLHRRWQRMGKMNEITVPSVSWEENDPMVNDVTVNPKSFDLHPNPPRLGVKGRGKNPIRNNPKAYDLRPNELRKRSRPRAQRKLHRPFPGYTWNRRDPEGSYQRNANLLRSGKTGLSPQQIKTHLARLQHMRDKQLARRHRVRDSDDWLTNEPRQALAQAHARTYTLNNNISALHPKIIVEEFDMAPPPPAPARGA